MFHSKRAKNKVLFLFIMIITFLVSACQQENLVSDKIQVLSTTTIVGDVVKNIGGEYINQVILLPPGIDPHSFDPAPRDITAIVDAQLVFANGAGLEEFLEPLIESAGSVDKVVYVSDGISLLYFEKPASPVGEQDAYNQGDPHTWTDPNNVLVWVDNILNALIETDPAHATAYEANAAAYRQSLIELNTWIEQQVDQIPSENREIVTDHEIFGYFAHRYGFVQVGAIIPSFSTAAEASANELANLQNAILDFNTKAIFIGNTVNPDLATQIAQDTGTSLNFVFTGSLSKPDGEAPTYIEYIHYNTNVIVTALR